MLNKIWILLPIVFLASSTAFGQSSRVRWQRQESVGQELHLFHSPHAINLPTSETLQKGDFEFEISHRFIPPVTEGGDALWGLDGPVNMRFGLGYAPSNKMVITLGRSNVDDNVDLLFKYKALQFDHKLVPILIGTQFGTAWNTQVVGRAKSDDMNFQYFGQLVLNTLIQRKLGLGVVPTYVYNSHITCPSKEYSFTLGSYAQYYITHLLSVLVEWTPTVTGFRKDYNSVAAGIELETGGHFFKIFLTNNSKLNQTQFHNGADLAFGDGDWRLGFVITRLLKF